MPRNRSEDDFVTQVCRAWYDGYMRYSLPPDKIDQRRDDYYRMLEDMTDNEREQFRRLTLAQLQRPGAIKTMRPLVHGNATIGGTRFPLQEEIVSRHAIGPHWTSPTF